MKDRAVSLWIAETLLSGCTAPEYVELPATPLNQAPEKPRVILIMVSDLRYGDDPDYGTNRTPTPNIDRIRIQNVRSIDVFVTAPACGPYRPCFQAGRRQSCFGFEFSNCPLARDSRESFELTFSEVTIADELKRHGFHARLVGKWRLGFNDFCYPTNRDNSEFVSVLSGTTGFADCVMPDVQQLPIDQALFHAGVMRAPLNTIHQGSDQIVVSNEDEYTTGCLGARAVQSIVWNAASEEPCFLYLTPVASHDALEIQEQYGDRSQQIRSGANPNRIYAEMASALDDMVGDVVGSVDESEEPGNTQIFCLSDDGRAAGYPDMCACEPIRVGKLTHFEGRLCDPFMVCWPDKLDGDIVYREMILSSAISPTFVTATVGWFRDGSICYGVDLLPYLRSDRKLWKSTDGKFTFLFNLSNDLKRMTHLASCHLEELKAPEDICGRWAPDMLDPLWPPRRTKHDNVCGTPHELGS